MEQEPNKQEQSQEDELLTTKQAAEILSKNAGREIKTSYVRVLGSYGTLTPVPLDERTNRWRRSEVEALYISDKPGRKKIQKHGFKNRPKTGDNTT